MGVIMTSCSQSKKRPRSPSSEDIDQECVPISKRINRLHIETGLQSNQNNVTSINLTSPQEELNLHCRNMRIRSESQDHQYNNAGAGTSGNNNMPPDNTNCMACTAGQGNPYYQELLEGYKPELTETENPHYFHANKLLFNIHAETIKRHKDGHMNT